jgi:hypothetical protein
MSSIILYPEGGRTALSDLTAFSLSVLVKWSVRSRDCLSPQGEFHGCSGMSLHRQERQFLSEGLLCHLPPL